MTALVLLPGLDGTGDLFEPLLAALPRQHRTSVVSYSPNRPQRYDDLLRVVDDAVPRAEPYVVVAESFSGPLAIRHAAENPRRLRGLVLCASFASNPMPPALRGLRAFARATTFLAPVPRAFVRAFLAGRDCPVELADAIVAAVRRASPAVLALRLREVFDVDVRQELERIDVPTLYIRGSRDRLVGRRGLAGIAARVPTLTSVVLNAPHLVLQTRPDDAAREIARFVERL